MLIKKPIKKVTIVGIVSAFVILGLTLGLYFGLRQNHHGRIIGYYKETATGFQCSGIPEMTPANIPHQYYTHLIYCFSPGVNINSWELDRIDDNEDARLVAFNKLKSKNSGLKTMLSLGGDLPSVAPMSQMSLNSTRIAIYVASVINFVKNYGFDGIDVDWEYPGDTGRGGSINDDTGFVNMIKAFRVETLRKGLLLSAALPGGSFWGRMYKVAEVIDHIDWFNIMAYNVLGVWREETHCSSPLENAIHPEQESVANAIRYFTRDVPASKFNLGISLWGITYKLKPGEPSKIGARSYVGPLADAGWCTKQKGYLSYFEIMKIKESSSAKEDPVEACKYFIYNTDQWVAYDEIDTYRRKIDFAVNQGLGGISVWGMDSDIPGEWPLTKQLSSLMGHT